MLAERHTEPVPIDRDVMVSSKLQFANFGRQVGESCDLGIIDRQALVVLYLIDDKRCFVPIGVGAVETRNGAIHELSDITYEPTKSKALHSVAVRQSSLALPSGCIDNGNSIEPL